jgi:hypothetical protein
MKIKRTSPLTGIEHEMEIAVTREQLDAWLGGVNVQDAMPNLTPAEREFIKTGYTQEDWDAMFPPEDDGDAFNMPGGKP